MPQKNRFVSEQKQLFSTTS